MTNEAGLELENTTCNPLPKDQKDVDYIVSKDDDELLKKWVMIGHHFFECGIYETSTIELAAEACPISVKLTSEGTFAAAQIVGTYEKVDEIDLFACVDRTEALRLAGLLIAWASSKNLHT